MKRDNRYKFWLGHTKKMTYPHTLAEIGGLIKEWTSDIIPLEFTGFDDKNGNKIFEGDIISDWVDTDEGLIKSHKQVFWNNKRGGWYVDDSYVQDKTEGIELWFELYDFDYEISGNIYENTELLKPLKN